MLGLPIFIVDFPKFLDEYDPADPNDYEKMLEARVAKQKRREQMELERQREMEDEEMDRRREQGIYYRVCIVLVMARQKCASLLRHHQCIRRHPSL